MNLSKVNLLYFYRSGWFALIKTLNLRRSRPSMTIYLKLIHIYVGLQYIIWSFFASFYHDFHMVISVLRMATKTEWSIMHFFIHLLTFVLVRFQKIWKIVFFINYLILPIKIFLIVYNYYIIFWWVTLNTF